MAQTARRHRRPAPRQVAVHAVRSYPADTVRRNRGRDPQRPLRKLPMDARLPSACNFYAPLEEFGRMEASEFRLPRRRCAVAAPPAGGSVCRQESCPLQLDRARPAISTELIPYHPTFARSIIAVFGYAALASSPECPPLFGKTPSQASRIASAICVSEHCRITAPRSKAARGIP